MKNQVINKVRDFRTEAGMTQAQTANRVGVSRQSIISIEKGQYIPSLPLALKIARLFGTSTDAVFQLKESSNDR